MMTQESYSDIKVCNENKLQWFLKMIKFKIKSTCFILYKLSSEYTIYTCMENIKIDFYLNVCWKILIMNCNNIIYWKEEKYSLYFC